MTEKKNKKEIKENVLTIPQEIVCSIEKDSVILKKGDDILTIPYNHVFVSVDVKDNTITIKPNNKKKMFLSVSNTIKKIINNAVNGFSKDYVYKMEVVYSHFPMTVKIDKNKLIISNFYGEKKPRVVSISKNVNIQVNGKEIVLSGKDKQAVGQTAGAIEAKTRMKNKDYRVFDDGIYIVEKAK